MGNLAYRDEIPYEIIHGKTVMMSPRPAINHNRVAGNIYHLFRLYLKGKRCQAFMDGVDVHFDEENTFVPDAFIVCNKDIIKGGRHLWCSRLGGGGAFPFHGAE